MWSGRAKSARRFRDDLFIIVALVVLVWAIITCVRASQYSSWDFVAFWGAGKALNLGLDPYQPGTWQGFGVPAGFYSPIFLAEIFQPIAALLPNAMKAKLIWTGFNIVAGAALSLILVRVSGLRVNFRSFAIAVALLVAFEPFTGVMQLGQTDIMVVLAVAISWLLIEYRRYFLAGLIFCLGASNPHLILGIGVYYLYRAIFRREWTLLLGLIAGGLAFIASSAVYLNYTIEWVTQVLPPKQAIAATELIQVTIIHLVNYYGSSLGWTNARLLKVGELLTVAVTLVTLVAAVMIWRRVKGRSMAIEMGAAVVLTVMSTTFAYHQDLMLLTLIAPSLVAMWRDTHSVEKVGYLATCASTFLFSALVGFVGYGQYEYRQLFFFVAPFLAGVLLLTQLRASQTEMLRVIPWAIAAAVLSIAGDLLPTLVSIKLVETEITLVLLGLLGYLLGIWRWYGGPTPVRDEREDERQEDYSPERQQDVWQVATVKRATVTRPR